MFQIFQDVKEKCVRVFALYRSVNVWRVLTLIIGVLGLAISAFGLLLVFRNSQRGFGASGDSVVLRSSEVLGDSTTGEEQATESGAFEESRAFEASETSETPEVSKVSEVLVDVSGGVEKPGVYVLRVGQRISDALEKAGGLSRKADLTVVQKKMNLAQKVVDEMKIYFPLKGEEELADVICTNVQVKAVAPSSSDTKSAETTDKININTASEKQLMELDGIGQVWAEKIIQNRPYSNIDELTTKAGLSEGGLDKISAQITI